MRIAVVVTGGLHPSGREQVVPSWLALFSALASPHDIHAFALRHLPEPRTYALNGFTVHDLGRPAAPFGLTRVAQEQALHRALARHGPFDLVHGLWGDPAGRLAVRIGRALAIPSLVTFDSGEFVSLPEIEYGSQRTWRGRRAIAEAALATRTHVCSQFMAATAAVHGLEPVVIPLTTVTASSPAREPGFTGSRPLRLIQVASLSKVKNQRMLIDAVAILRNSIDVRLDLVGEDTLGGALQQHAAASGVADAITFHGFVPQDLLRPLLHAASVYVQSSLHEAAGVSVLEAAAAGLPVIGTRLGYVADWSADRALAIDRADAPSLAEAIRRFASDPNRAGALAARARAWVLERSTEWVARRFDELYADLSAREMAI